MTAFGAPLVVHVGYPKTATTMFQQNVFPMCPEIEYLGKFVPSHRYRDERTYYQIDALLRHGTLYPPNLKPLRDYVEQVRGETRRRVVLISSESFIHPAVIDIGEVAKRIKDAFGECRILITIREQISAILSFYWTHGRYGEYLSLGPRDTSKKLSFPLSFSEWVNLQMDGEIAEGRNYVSTLRYGDVIACYDGIFGRDNVQVLLFEMLLYSPDVYCEELSKFLGIQSCASLMKKSQENRSTGRLDPWKGKDIDRFLKREWLSLFRRLFPRQRRVDEGRVEVLQDYFRPSNRRLIEERNIPIAKFGYVL